MTCALFVWSSLLVLVTIEHVECNYTCLSGTNVLDPIQDTQIEHCSSTQQCSTEQYVTVSGRVGYNLACKAPADCGGATSASTSITICSECCQGNLCSVSACGLKGYPSGHGPICYHCDNPVADPASCTTIRTCGSDEICQTLAHVHTGTCAECCPSDLCNTKCHSGTAVAPTTPAKVVDYCNSNPCVNGACHNSGTGFSCVCSSGFVGVHCDQVDPSSHRLQCYSCTYHVAQPSDCAHTALCGSSEECFTMKQLADPGYEVSCRPKTICRAIENAVRTGESMAWGQCCSASLCRSTPPTKPLTIAPHATPTRASTVTTSTRASTVTTSTRASIVTTSTRALTVRATKATTVTTTTRAPTTTAPNACSPNPCVHGLCHNYGSSYRCLCNSGYHGAHCEIQATNPCEQHPCVHGTCYHSGLSYTCNCVSGYHGIHCDQAVDACASNPCVRGQCLRVGPSFICSCSAGYQGALCDQVSAQLGCTFESGLCSWRQSRDDQFDWTRTHGATTSTGTGPSVDHTIGNSNGYYLYIETSRPRHSNDKSRLVSAQVSFTGPACLQFWYHMYGHNVNRLSVYRRVGSAALTTPIWTHTGTLLNHWYAARVNIQPSLYPYKLVFEGVVGHGSKGDIALDDISFSLAACGNV